MLSDTVVLARQLLADRQDGLDATAHVEHDGGFGGAGHHPGQDFAFAADVLVVHDVTLRLAEALAVDLARSLRRDPAELLLGDVLRDADPAADPPLLDLVRLGHGLLELGIGHLAPATTSYSRKTLISPVSGSILTTTFSGASALRR